MDLTGKESTQRKLDRVRLPHVEITYDVEAGGAIERKELPFVILVLSSLSGKRKESLPQLRDRRPIQIDFDKFDAVLAGIEPRIEFAVDNDLSGEGQLPIDLTFRHLLDFEPDQIIDQLLPLRNAYALRSALVNLRAETDAETVCQRARHLTAQLQIQPLSEEFAGSADPEAAVHAWQHHLDSLLSKQMNSILHHPDWRALEASWRGLHYLVSQTETGPMLGISVLDVSKRELATSLERSVEFDQSALFKKVYEDAYGTYGGQVFGALIGDYEFTHDSGDISLLDRLSQIVAAAHAPFIAAAGPEMFGFRSFTELAGPQDLTKIFDAVEYARWKSFRETEDSRYVGLTLPRILLRRPHGGRQRADEEFVFCEAVDNSEPGGRDGYLWGNAAYAFGSCLTNAFAKYHWCAAVRGIEGGGLIEGLPVQTFSTDEGEIAHKCPTEIAITDRREKELSDLGFIPLVSLKGTDRAAFFSAQSCQIPKKYDSDAATAHARLSAQLQYVLTTSRFAHYIKAIMRDKIGSFMSRGDCESILNRWISNYVIAETAGVTEKARRPLREARIDVTEAPGKPGNYRAAIFLSPHYQLEGLSVSLRIVVDLPTPRG